MTLVDTCYVIDLMRGDPGALEMQDVHADEGWPLQVCIVTVHELNRGLAQTTHPDREHLRMREALQRLHVLPFDGEAARLAGQIEGGLKRTGTPIDAEDCMIAGVALQHGIAVTTRNIKDFDRITGLQVQTY